MKRRFLLPHAWVGFLTLSLLGGCAEAGGPGQDRASTLTIHYPSGSDQWIITPWPNLGPQHLIYSPLFKLDEQRNPQGHLVRSWEHTEDYRVWTYHLRTDVRWHDGAPLTAHDVKFTYDLSAHPAIAHVDPAAHTIEVLDDSTFTSTRHLRSGLSLETWRVILPRHLMGGLDPEVMGQWEVWENPVGTGPFRFVRHVQGLGIELEASEDYFVGRPEVDHLVLRFGGQPRVELESGKADISGAMSRADMLHLAQDDRFEVYWGLRGAVMGGGTVWWNHRHPILGDVRVRRALTHAVDRYALGVILNRPPGLPEVDFPTTTAQVIRGEYPEPFAHDPELAMSLLEEAGWIDDDGDGIRERDGRELRFGFLTEREYEPTAIFLQDQYRRVGADLEIEMVPHGLLIQRLFEGSFESAMGGGGGGRVYRILLGEEGSPGAGYESPEFERVLAELESSFDPLALETAYRAMWPILQRDLPMGPLGGVGFFMTIANTRVKGLSSPGRVFPELIAATLRIEEGG